MIIKDKTDDPGESPILTKSGSRFSNLREHGDKRRLEYRRNSVICGSEQTPRYLWRGIISGDTSFVEKQP